MSYNMNFNEESNVAYLGTSEDLVFGDFDGFLKEGSDMQLFGAPEETPVSAEQRALMLLSAFNSANPATVSPQELTMAPPSGYVPSSASIPDLEFTPADSLVYDYSGDHSPLFSNPNSADPSPILQDDMAPPGAYSQLESLFAVEEPHVPTGAEGVYVPTGADLRARHTDSLPPPTPKSAVLGPSSSGVRKNPRKANRPLKVIDIESITDEKEKKKAKNTEAARRSRAKKADYEAYLEAQIKELQQQLTAEKAKNEQLQAYINGQLPSSM